MAEAEEREFTGEVYYNGPDGYIGRWAICAGRRIIEADTIHSLTEDGARFHVADAARLRGFAWEG